MIGILQGQVKIKNKDNLILMVSGVGYIVFTPQRLLNQVKPAADLLLFTHTHVREDQLSLFGFATAAELELFELLLSVSGIGPKTALAIVEREAQFVRQAVVTADVAFFTSIPRLGTKNAQKVIIELKSKLGSLTELDLTGKPIGETQTVLDSLVSMGFSKTEAVTAIQKIPIGLVTVEEKIKSALKLLGKY